MSRADIDVCIMSEDLIQLRFKQPLETPVHSLLEIFCCTLGVTPRTEVLSKPLYASFGMQIDANASITLKQVLEAQAKLFVSDCIDFRLEVEIRPLVYSAKAANVLCSISNWIFSKYEGA